MKELLKEIQKECAAVNEVHYVEIEYDGKYCPEFIDIRIYDAGYIAGWFMSFFFN